MLTLDDTSQVLTGTILNGPTVHIAPPCYLVSLRFAVNTIEHRPIGNEF